MNGVWWCSSMAVPPPESHINTQWHHQVCVSHELWCNACFWLDDASIHQKQRMRYYSVILHILSSLTSFILSNSVFWQVEEVTSGGGGEEGGVKETTGYFPAVFVKTEPGVGTRTWCFLTLTVSLNTSVFPLTVKVTLFCHVGTVLIK